MRHLVFLFSVFVLSIFSSCISDAITDDDLKVMVGDNVPLFEVEMLNGETFSTHKMIGDTYLIIFFSVTCTDCMRQLPEVDKAYRQLERSNAVIAISRAEPSATVETFWQENSFVLPVAAATDRRIYELFAVQGVPRLYFIDRQGKIIYMSDDKVTMRAEEIAKLLNN